MKRPDTAALLRLQQRRQEIWDEAHAIAIAASKSDRNLTPHEDRLFRMLSAELDRLDAEVSELRARLPRQVLLFTLQQRPPVL